jgi:membrane protein
MNSPAARPQMQPRAAPMAAGARDETVSAGRDAESPWKMPFEAWKQVAMRTWKESTNDNVGLIAAGVAFYGFLALVPLLGATVLTYGLVAKPETVISHMQALTSVLPADAARLVGEQLMNVVQTSGGKKGVGVLVALAIALFGARNGAGSIITALNVAYEEEEQRGFLRVNLLALGITAAAVVVGILAVTAIGALGHLETVLPGAPAFLIFLGKLLSYALLAAVAVAGTATLYRYGPSRQKARWTWLTPGSLFAGIMWLLLTFGFGIYVANFGNYDATYGSLGAVVVLLTWLYLSSYVLLFGAELNSELEHQTAKDTTEGGSAPIGSRGAWVADHVAESATEAAVKSKAVRPTAKNEASTGQDITVSAPNSPRSIPHEILVGRATARASSLAGLPKIGWVTSALASAGLTFLRRRGEAKRGTALLAAAAGLAFLTRTDR